MEDKIKENLEHEVIHKDFGTWVLEFCQAHNACSVRRIYGKEAKKLQKILAKISGGE